MARGENLMNTEKTAGVATIIIGLLLIIFPMFFSELISIIVGLSLLFFGISTIFMGYNLKHDMDLVRKVTMAIGIISVIVGLLFLFCINYLSFLVSLQFYIVGFIMLVFGITGLLYRVNTSTIITSIIVLLMGILSIGLAIFALNQPIYISIILGIGLVIEGVTFLLNAN